MKSKTLRDGSQRVRIYVRDQSRSPTETQQFTIIHQSLITSFQIRLCLFVRNRHVNIGDLEYLSYLCVKKRVGSLTEWLGSGLQNRVRRFESATNLYRKFDNATPPVS